MCDNWKRPLTEEMKPEEYSKLPKSVRYINVSGGEPFLRDDVPQIIRVLDKSLNRPKIDISTNGLLTDRIIPQMGEIKKIHARLGVRLSVDGIGERHDQVRGIKGAFDRVMATVKALKEMGFKDIGIGSVASNYNVDQITNVVKLAKSLNVEFMCCGVAQNSELTFSKSNKPIQNLSELKLQIDYMTREHMKTFKPRNWVRGYIDSGLYSFAYKGHREIHCSAGITFFFLTPNGDVYPDMVINRKFGNILDAPFEQIWYSPSANKFRADLSDVGNCPNPCWMTCTVFPWMRSHKLECARWMLSNKVRAHLNLPIKPSQE
jgi:MoaA/NifB/PqqE/SkfB family radical SAM enzyme